MAELLSLPPDQFRDLTRLGMTAGLPLREDKQTIGHDLEDPAGAFDKPDRQVGKTLLELGRQPGGPWLIVSDDAVGDLDLHGVLGGLPRASES
jgi:hypothetical protein